MVSSSLNPLQEFKVVKRNSLYYGLYQYSAQFYIKEASALRILDHHAIDKTLDFRTSWSTHHVPHDDRVAVHQACDSLLNIKNPYKTMVSYNWIYFYTNDIRDIDYLIATSQMRHIGEITTVEITHEKDTIGLKNPKYAYRTYIRSHRPTEQQIESLREFIKHGEQEIRASVGLREFLNRSKNRRYWMSDYYFVDHNDMKMVTALALMNPKLVRKTMPIVKVNN
jgi:hypothetical protein